MDYRELREVMKFLHCKGLLAKDIYADMLDTLGDSAPSYAMVKKWVTEFKKGRISDDIVRGSGRPRDVSTYENVDYIKNLVTDDERVTVQDIAKYVGISFGSVHTILSKLLELVKVSGRWVPRRVSDERKMTRLEFCKEYLAWYRVNPGRLVQQTVVDDAWIYHFERTDILFQPPGQNETENGDEPSESGNSVTALSKEKPSSILRPNCDNESAKDNLRSTKNPSGEQTEPDEGITTVKSEVQQDVPDEKSPVTKTESEETQGSEGISKTSRNGEPKIIQDDEVGSTDSKNDVKLEGSSLENGDSGKNVGNTDKVSEVSTSNSLDLSVKKTANGSPMKVINDVKVSNSNTASSNVPNMLALLGQRPANGAAGVPGMVPIMGSHGLTLGQLGASLTGINVAQLAALTGMNQSNFAHLTGVGLAQLTPEQMLAVSANGTGAKRPNSDGNHLPKKKQRKDRPLSGASFVFWDSEGVVHAETLEAGEKLTGELYCDMLKRLKDSMDKKRPGALDSGILLLEDQAPTGAKPPRGMQLLPVPVNSPDLSPSDFHIFPKVKEHLRCSRLSSGLNSAVEAFIKALDDSYFKSALTEMERRCTMCVDLNGDYVDK